jgi:hypothetical protein
MELTDKLVELRSQLGRATSSEQTQLLSADIERVQRVMKIEDERLASQDLSGRVRTAQRIEETDTAFRQRAEKELERVAQV